MGLSHWARVNRKIIGLHMARCAESLSILYSASPFHFVILTQVVLLDQHRLADIRLTQPGPITAASLLSLNLEL